jgi:hypothetical protein
MLINGVLLVNIYYIPLADYNNNINNNNINELQTSVTLNSQISEKHKTFQNLTT